MKSLLLFGICLLFTIRALGQGCVSINNNCGTTVFVQDSVPACSNSIALPAGCAVDTAKDPVWYSFYGLKNGSLGFVITPEKSSDDYNWTLFDVGSSILDTEKIPSLIVGGNWSGERGKTGASDDGEDALVCPSPTHSPPYPSPFSTMPYIEKGHQYLLMVSHNKGFVQNGYTLSFNHGSDVIIDTNTARLKKIEVACDGRSIAVFLTSDRIQVTPHFYYGIGIRSGSLAADGSDFKLLNTSVGIKSAYSNSGKFNMTKFTLELDGQLKPGQYTLVLQKGSDGNTLLGNCPNKSILVGAGLDFVKQYIPSTPMKRVVKLGCNAQSIQVAFADKIKCNSIATDGSDFSIVNANTGKHLTITRAESVYCNYNLSDTFRIYLAKPIYKKGVYHLYLKKGTDGNTAFNECGMASPGQKLTFKSPGAVSAVINSKLQYECNKAKVTLSNPGGNGVNKWVWTSSSGKTSNSASLSFIDTAFKTQTIKLKVSNGICNAEDSMQLNFNKDYYLHAAFTMPSFVCPQDPVNISNESNGMNITQWNWSFGNGKYGNQEDPGIQHYPATTFTKKYPVKLTITNSLGCSDTATKEIKVFNTCKVYVPTAFTPNHDGMNDYLHPLNAFLAKDLSFKVYDRWGKLVFQTKDPTQGWDGALHGNLQAEGSYVWILRFVNSKTGKKVFRKGAALLIR